MCTHVPNEILTTRGGTEILADKFIPGRETGARLGQISDSRCYRCKEEKGEKVSRADRDEESRVSRTNFKTANVNVLLRRQ